MQRSLHASYKYDRRLKKCLLIFITENSRSTLYSLRDDSMHLCRTLHFNGPHSLVGLFACKNIYYVLNGFVVVICVQSWNAFYHWFSCLCFFFSCIFLKTFHSNAYESDVTSVRRLSGSSIIKIELVEHLNKVYSSCILSLSDWIYALRVTGFGPVFLSSHIVNEMVSKCIFFFFALSNFFLMRQKILCEYALLFNISVSCLNKAIQMASTFFHQIDFN